jgi:hypothetical protein
MKPLHGSLILLLLLLLLTSCGSIGAVVGTGTSGYESYKTITYAKSAVDLGLSATDKKTTDDRILSSITGYDCKVKRVLKGGLEAICVSLIPEFIGPPPAP